MTFVAGGGRPGRGMGNGLLCNLWRLRVALGAAIRPLPEELGWHARNGT